MLLLVGACDFDLKEPDVCLLSDPPIGSARDFDGIDRVGDYGSTQAKIIGGDTINCCVASRSDFSDGRQYAGRPYRLFNGIYTQIEGIDLSGQTLSDGAFSRARQSPKYYQHRFSF
jgi:hypothetical protein